MCERRGEGGHERSQPRGPRAPPTLPSTVHPTAGQGVHRPEGNWSAPSPEKASPGVAASLRAQDVKPLSPPWALGLPLGTCLLATRSVRARGSLGFWENPCAGCPSRPRWAANTHLRGGPGWCEQRREHRGAGGRPEGDAARGQASGTSQTVNHHDYFVMFAAPLIFCQKMLTSRKVLKSVTIFQFVQRHISYLFLGPRDTALHHPVGI